MASSSRKRPRLRGAPPASHLNKTVAERLEIEREFESDAYAYYDSELDRDMIYQDELTKQLEEEAASDDPLDADARVLYQNVQNRLEGLWRSAFLRHTRLRDALKPSSPINMRTYVRVSWTIVCRFALLLQQVRDMFTQNRGYARMPSCLLKRATDFTYVRTVNEHHVPISLSDEILVSYSLHVLMTSGGLLCEALDSYGWSPSAGDYLEALFLRYCLFVHMPGEHAGDPHDFARWEGSPASGKLPDALLSPAPVNSAFVNVGERLFFHHIWRSRVLREHWAANHTIEDALHQPLHLPTQLRRAQWRQERGLPALSRLLVTLLNHEVLGDEARTRFATMYPARLLWPGQREQFMFEYPNESQGGRPDAALYRLRIVVYKAMQRMEKQGEPTHSITRYVNDEHAMIDTLHAFEEQGSPPPPTLGHWLDTEIVMRRCGFDTVKLVDPERVLLLLFEIAFELRIAEVLRIEAKQYFVQNAYVDDRSLSDVTKARPNYAFAQLDTWRRASGWPLFVAIWTHYTVASSNVVHTTPHLVDALGLWLREAQKSRESGPLLMDHKFFDDPEWQALVMPDDLVLA